MKASFTLRSASEKVPAIVTLVAVMTWVFYPATHLKAANSLQTTGNRALVFEVKNLPATYTVASENTDQNVSNNPQVQVANLSYKELLSANMGQITKDAYKEQLRSYLTQRRSPFAQCVDLLVELPTSDKILALANAESAMGRRAPHGLHNYWGIGGSRLWKMGNNVCEGIQSMDNFLHEYPRRAAVKYKDMSFVDMCGIYKQPCPGKANHHWVKNNNVIISDLQRLRSQAQQTAQAHVDSGNHFTIATAEATLQ